MPNMPKKLNVPAPQTQFVQMPSAIPPQMATTTKATATQQKSQKRQRTSQSITESDESIVSTQICAQLFSASKAPSLPKRATDAEAKK